MSEAILSENGFNVDGETRIAELADAGYRLTFAGHGLQNAIILVVAYHAGYDLPSMCLQGWCITCAARVEGPGEWDHSASLRYFPQDRKAGFILLCTARARSDLVIRTHQRVAMRDHRLANSLPTPRA